MRERLWGLLLLGGVLSASMLYVDLRDERRVAAAQASATGRALAEATALRQQLTRSISSVEALDSIIRQFGDVPDFSALADDMIGSYGGITNLQLAPGGVIRDIHPLPGNERALGLDLLDPATPGSDKAQAAIEEHRLTVAGPLKLVQGGVALIARSPVFISDNLGGERFWGFATALIQVEDLLRASRLERLGEAGFDFALAQLRDGHWQSFASSNEAPLNDPVTFRFDVIGGAWELALAPSAGWYDRTAQIQDGLLALFASLVAALLVWSQLRRPARLAAEVARGTQDLDTVNRDLHREIIERETVERALRESEAHSRGVLEHATDGLYVHDAKGRFVEVNPAACQMLGYSREQLLQLRVSDVASPDKFISFDAAREQLVGGETATINCQLHRKDGGRTPVEVCVGRIQEQEPPQFIAVARDVTEREAARHLLEQANDALEQQVEVRTAELNTVNRNLVSKTQERQQAEAELKVAKATAEAANRAKSQFLGIISHEIRTPMNGLLGMISLLREGDLPPDLHGYAQVADASGKLLMGLLGELVDISRIEHGQPAVRRGETEIVRLLHQVIDLHRWRAREKGVALELACDPGLPAWILIDAGRLRQVLNNLVGNAVKFTDDGRVTIHADSPRDGWLRVVVQDTGVGIEPQVQRVIFESFTQANRSIARRYGGTGLGLAIAKQLVQIMDGTIDVESLPGKGSTFRIELPAPPAANKGAVDVTGQGPTQHAGHCRVLVAEDNAVNRQVAIGMLKRLGCEITAVVDGQEALDVTAREHYDLLLMDCQMPRLDGYEATRQLREREPAGQHLPVVAMTAHALPEDVAHCLAVGMDDHLAKPITVERLRRIIERWARPWGGDDG